MFNFNKRIKRWKTSDRLNNKISDSIENPMLSHNSDNYPEPVGNNYLHYSNNVNNFFCKIISVCKNNNYSSKPENSLKTGQV